MKKYGKYEKRPEGIPAKQPKVKSALLQTYLTSLLCMVLCVTMFFGTSYAWFTSEVNNVGNEIYIGTLDVDLQKFVGTATADLDSDSGWASLKTTDVELSSEDVSRQTLFSKDIRWEPNYTAVETVRVKDMGDLDFNYQLRFVLQDGNGTLNAAEAMEVAKYFTVFTKEGQYTPAEGDSFAAYITKENGWTGVGTLAEILTNDLCIYSGDMAHTENGTKDPEEDVFTIAMHLDENAPSSIMGKKIILNVKLIAYQYGAEADAFGETYDEDAAMPISSEASLRRAVEQQGQNAVLSENITLSEQLNVLTNVSIDLNGKSLDGADFIVENGAKLTLTGSGTFNQSLKTVKVQGELVICGGTYFGVPGTDESGNTVYTSSFTVEEGGKMTITGGTFGFDPGAYVAEGYETVKDADNAVWTVVEKSGS